MAAVPVDESKASEAPEKEKKEEATGFLEDEHTGPDAGWKRLFQDSPELHRQFYTGCGVAFLYGAGAFYNIIPFVKRSRLQRRRRGLTGHFLEIRQANLC